MAEVPGVEKKEETTAIETVVNADGTSTTTESKTTKETRAGFSEEKTETKSETVSPKGFWGRRKARQEAKVAARATKGRNPVVGWFGSSARSMRSTPADERAQVMVDTRIEVEHRVRDYNLRGQALLDYLIDERSKAAGRPDGGRRQEAFDALYGEQLVKKAKEGVGSLTLEERTFVLNDLVNRGLDSAFSDIAANAKGFANMQEAMRLMDIDNIVVSSEEQDGVSGVATGKSYKRKWVETLPKAVRTVLEKAGLGMDGSLVYRAAQWDSFQDKLPRYWRERWTDMKRAGVGVGIAGVAALVAPICLPAVLVGAGGAMAFRAISDYAYRERNQKRAGENGVGLNRNAFNELSEIVLKAREEAQKFERRTQGLEGEQLEEERGKLLNSLVDRMLRAQTTAVDEFKRIERVGKVVNAISGAVGGIAAGATWGAFQYHEKVTAAQELAKEGLWMKGAQLAKLDLSQLDLSLVSPERVAELHKYQERFEQVRGLLGGVDQATNIVVNPDGSVTDGHAVEFVKNGWHRLVDTYQDRDINQVLQLLEQGKGGNFTTFADGGSTSQLMSNYVQGDTYHHVADHVGPLGHLLKHHWPEVYAALARDAVLGGGLIGGFMGVGRGGKVKTGPQRRDHAQSSALMDERFPVLSSDYFGPEATHLRDTLDYWATHYGLNTESPTDEQLARRSQDGGKVVGLNIHKDGYIERIIGRIDGSNYKERIPLPESKQKPDEEPGGSSVKPGPDPTPGPESPTAASQNENAQESEESDPAVSEAVNSELEQNQETATQVEPAEPVAPAAEEALSIDREQQLRDAYRDRLTRVAGTFADGSMPLEQHTWLRAFYRPAGGRKAEELPQEIENLATLRHVLGIPVPSRRDFATDSERRQALRATLDEIWPALERSLDVIDEVSESASGREREFYDAMNGYLSTAYTTLLDSPISNLHQLRVEMSKAVDKEVQTAAVPTVETGTKKNRDALASAVRGLGIGRISWDAFEPVLADMPTNGWQREVFAELSKANALPSIIEAANRALAYLDAKQDPQDIGTEFLSAFNDPITQPPVSGSPDLNPSSPDQADQLPPAYEWAQLPTDHHFEAVGRFGLNQLPDPEASPVPFSDFVVRLLMDVKSAVLYDPKAVHEIIRQQIQERERQGSFAVEIDTLYAADLLSTAVDAAIKKEQTSEKIAEQFSSETLQEAYVPKVLAQTLSKLASFIRTGIAADEEAAKQLDQVARILEARS